MKILVLRFSSIGDIVLTTPVIRCLKKQIPNAEIHFLTKNKFKCLLEENPHIHTIHGFDHSYKEVLGDLKRQQFDYVIDLHKNIRSLSLRFRLKVPSYSFPKLNLKKLLLVRFKVNRMPERHIVERYFSAVTPLNVQNDRENCELFLAEKDQIKIPDEFGVQHFLAVAIGAQFATKRLPYSKLRSILAPLSMPIILLGDQHDAKIAEQLISELPDKNIIQACGKYSIKQSASIVQQADALLSHDTGLMHIATAFQVPIISVWGNTVPALGMYPYYPKQPEMYSIHEVPNLSCRPCSKIGFQSCPKKHFNCMNLQNEEEITKRINERFSN
ncbi:MAG: glycosyltransferase family 9 protein [Bacteroidetes bacterium]|nr:MAG: glycosyltransferase family 9 protein [Bacteroidota bacterium]